MMVLILSGVILTAALVIHGINLATDHTGDPNGYFMLINASFQQGVFYLDTVKGLCTDYYEFAAWIANVLKSSAVVLTAFRPISTFSMKEQMVLY